MNTPGISPANALAETHPVNNMAPPTGRSTACGSARSSLRGGRSLLIPVLIFAAVSLAAGWAWFGTTAILPLLYVLPCAAMLAMCMKGHGGSGEPAVKPGNGTSDTDMPQ